MAFISIQNLSVLSAKTKGVNHWVYMGMILWYALKVSKSYFQQLRS